MHYLLNQYDKWKKDGVSLFVVDYPAAFENRYPSRLRDADNPERALEFCYDKDAKEHGLPNFGNVLVEFFNIEDDTEFEGYMIRNIFDARGIDPSEIPNSWYGENFKFVAQVNGCIKINFDDESKTDGFLPNWFLDKDNDGYHAKGIAPKKQANSPGTDWVEGVSKGEDCDDTNPNKKDKGDCFNLNDPCANKDLRNKKVSDKVKREEIESRVHNILQAPGTRIDIPEFGIQEIEDGRGDINADKYELDITKLPNGVTAQQLFEDIRKNFFTLVTGGNNLLEKATFMGYAPEDFNSWNSSNPIGSAMDFDTLLDTATVIATEYSLQEMFWTFTTVTSKDHFGHPVSGHRQFRLRANPDGSHTFVVRGSDRLSTLLDYSVNSVGDDFAFDLADNTWKNLMKSIEGFIKAKPGGEVKPFDKSKQYGIRYKYNENDCK